MHDAAAAVEVRHTDASIDAKIARGGLGDDAHGAALAVAAEERALRALQHLDALDIEHGHTETLGAAEEHAIHIDADAGITSGLVGIHRRADAADAEVQSRRPADEGRDAQRRDRTIGQAAERDRLTVLQTLAREDIHGDRRVLERGLALLRSDDHLFQGGDRGRLLRVQHTGGGSESDERGRLGCDFHARPLRSGRAGSPTEMTERWRDDDEQVSVAADRRSLTP